MFKKMNKWTAEYEGNFTAQKPPTMADPNGLAVYAVGLQLLASCNHGRRKNVGIKNIIYKNRASRWSPTHRSTSQIIANIFDPVEASNNTFLDRHCAPEKTLSCHCRRDRCAQCSDGETWPEGKRPLGRPRRRWEDNIKRDLEEVGRGCGDWMELAQDRDSWRVLVSTVMNFGVP